MLLDMRYQNRYVDTHVRGGSNMTLDLLSRGYSLIVNDHNLGHNGAYNLLTWGDTVIHI